MGPGLNHLSKLVKGAGPSPFDLGFGSDSLAWPASIPSPLKSWLISKHYTMFHSHLKSNQQLSPVAHIQVVTQNNLCFPCTDGAGKNMGLPVGLDAHTNTAHSLSESSTVTLCLDHHLHTSQQLHSNLAHVHCSGNPSAPFHKMQL